MRFEACIQDLKRLLPNVENDEFKWDGAVAVLVKRYKQNEKEKSSALQLTDSAEAPDALSKTQGFFPSLTVNEVFPMERLKLPLRVHTSNIAALSRKKLSPKMAGVFKDDSLLVRRRPPLNVTQNPSLQLTEAHKVRDLLEPEDVFVFVRKAGSPTIYLFGLKRGDVAQTKVDVPAHAIAITSDQSLLGKEIIIDYAPEVGLGSSVGKESLSELVQQFAADAKPGRLRVDAKVAHRLAACLLSKRFLIATGLAGSGKTKLAQAFAHWITPDGLAVAKCYEVIPVGADWTSNENVLGYPSGLDKVNYLTKPALDLILQAVDNPDIPYFLILDEMNLSHVERYFADILSAMESEEKIPLHDDNERRNSGGRPIPPKLMLPTNLFFIGTVNVDETTYMFSPKVLDRANVIEFRMEAHELEAFIGNPAKPDLTKLDGKGVGFGKPFVDAARGPADVSDDVKVDCEQEMMLFFKALQGHGSEFGYRVAHEAARFVHFYKLLGGHPAGDASWFPEAFDCVVVQKFLPKLHGSRARLGPLLKKLWFLCVHDAAGRGTDALQRAEEAARSTDKKAEPSTAPEILAEAHYPLSAEKIGRMWRLLNENGFASFAEA